MKFNLKEAILLQRIWRRAERDLKTCEVGTIGLLFLVVGRFMRDSQFKVVGSGQQNE